MTEGAALVLAGTLIGAVVGAAGAIVSARIIRDETRSTRSYDARLAAYTDLLLAADVHMRQLEGAVARIREVVRGAADANSVPQVDTTEPVRRAGWATALQGQELGALGREVYEALVALDMITEPARLDPRRGLTPDEEERWDEGSREYAVLVSRFAASATDDLAR